ncbi:hypothetical protein MG3_02090 [Candida albicans P78048]|uniref:ADF-H domain-containing protein n=2 Tax=Candida albicans TaxID=5476 RepID=A0A1D8PHR2_CANAL|nr:uncharacterized protein CAALFM_C206770WA [Candida albicans SC5314]AOW27678.1 hypothetical protein CAALFM_C206770WA [Candida albicans SC5314]KGR13660.1 hypothetical protein MG3_02090 [Candida albicans P78048]KGU35263.1 hypothetical protein MGK_02079 [Candida albicans P57055]|eukprot:XP_714819.2 hypothetical protein CAALFM_C206770WA [Candida albicans SC5314]
MSTQSGITISSQLNDAYKNLSTNSALIIKISSDSTELIPDQIITGSDNTTSTTKDITILEPIFEKLINQISQEFPHPSYIVISYNSNQYFISFIPDIAPIKQKMLYASTKNSLITSLGGNKLIKKFAWTELDELTLNYFIKSIDDDQGSNIKKEEEEELNLLLTEDEITLQKLNNLSLYSTTNHHHHGFKKKLPSMTNDDGSTTGSGNADQDILYKFTPELTEQLQSIIENSSPESSNDNDNKKSLISFNIDTTKELLTLKSIDTQIEINQLIDTLNNHTSSRISPQYILYNYQIGKLAFIYSCPSGSSVKDRMIYASFKNSLINHLNQLIKSTNIDDDIIIDKNIEVGDLDEIELSQLQDANELIHDTNTNGNNNSSSNSLSSNNSSLSSKNGLKFNKPKGPRRR